MSEEFSKKYVIFVSLGVSFVLFCLAFSLASDRGLWSSLETQSAQIAREFLRGGDLIVPHLNGIEDNEKPAFYFKRNADTGNFFSNFLYTISAGC